MAGRNMIGAEGHRMIKKCFKFDFSIAQHIRIGGAARRVLSQKIGKNTIFVFGSKIHCLDIDAHHIGHARSVKPVLSGRTVLGIVIVLPVLHEQTNDLIALLFQEPSGHRRINSAGHSDDDTFF